MTAGRTLWAAMRILDRQLITNEGRLAGCVDDLELTASPDGNELYVTGILSGPGALAYRLRARRLGRWLRHAHDVLSPHNRPDPTHIPFNLVADIGSHVSLGCAHEDVGVEALERWTRDHIVAHIPGAGHVPE